MQGTQVLIRASFVALAALYAQASQAAVLDLPALAGSGFKSNCYTFAKDLTTAPTYSQKVILFSQDKIETQVINYSDAACTELRGAIRSPWTMGTITAVEDKDGFTAISAVCEAGCTTAYSVAYKISDDGLTLFEAGKAADGTFYTQTPVTLTKGEALSFAAATPEVVTIITELGFLQQFVDQTWESTCYQFGKDVVNGVWNVKTLSFKGSHIDSSIAQFSDAFCTVPSAEVRTPWSLDATGLATLENGWNSVSAHCASGCSGWVTYAYSLLPDATVPQLLEAGKKSDGTFYIESPLVFMQK